MVVGSRILPLFWQHLGPLIQRILDGETECLIIFMPRLYFIGFFFLRILLYYVKFPLTQNTQEDPFYFLQHNRVKLTHYSDVGNISCFIIVDVPICGRFALDTRFWWFVRSKKKLFTIELDLTLSSVDFTMHQSPDFMLHWLVCSLVCLSHY